MTLARSGGHGGEDYGGVRIGLPQALTYMAFHAAGAPDTASAPNAEPYPQPPDAGASGYGWVRLLGSVSATPVFGSSRDRMTAIADQQRGYASRGQLLAAGVPSTTIDRHVAGRWLRPVHRAVFSVGHRAPIPLGPETAALLAIRDGAALSHHSAAVLWGMTSALPDEAPIHLTVPGSPGGHPSGVIMHRSGLFTTRDLRVRHGLPVTSPARVLLDLAPQSADRDLERLLDQGLVSRVLRLGDVAELLRRCGRHHGRWALQALLEHHTTTTFTRSDAEERFLQLVRDAQLPQPLVNVRRHGFEIDFLWPEHGVAAEIDGFTYHRTHHRFEHDHDKDARLTVAGIDVIRFTWRQLRDEPLAVVAATVRALTSRRQKGR